MNPLIYYHLKSVFIDSWFFLRGNSLEKSQLPCVPILTYHSIGCSDNSFFPVLPPTVFEEQIRYLSKRFRLITLQTLMSALSSGVVPKESLVLTFDDGYKDNFTVALPILKQYGAVGTLFLTTNCIGTGLPLWTDVFGALFQETTVKSLYWRFGKPETFSWTCSQEKILAFKTIKNLIKTLPEDRKIEVLADIEEQLGSASSFNWSQRMLDWDEVRILHEAGIEIGGHTSSHPILSRISEEQVYRELSDSKNSIEDKIQAPVTSLAYPNGTINDYNEEIQRIAEEVGYRSACTTIDGVVTSSSSLFALPRLYTTEPSLSRFAWLLSRNMKKAFQG